MSAKNNKFLDRVAPFLALSFFLPCLFGCGLFAGGNKNPAIETVPPYYSGGGQRAVLEADKDEMAAHAKHFRQAESEWNRMDELSKREARRNKEEKEEEERNKKTSWWPFSGNDDRFLRSDEAAKINSNLER